MKYIGLFVTKSFRKLKLSQKNTLDNVNITK